MRPDRGRPSRPWPAGADRPRRLVPTGFTDSPLLRTSDRLQAWVTFSLVLLWLALAPLTAGLTAVNLYRAGVAHERADAGRVYRMEATVVGSARPLPVAGVAARPLYEISLAWPSRTGQQRSTIEATQPLPAGARWAVWVDGDGARSAAPQTRLLTVGDTAAGALLALGAFAVLLSGIQAAVTAALDRHRQRAWDREWAAVAPVWTRRT